MVAGFVGRSGKIARLAQKEDKMNEELKLAFAIETGTSIVDLMEQMVSSDLPEGLEVDEGSIKFQLTEVAGELQGSWEIIVRKAE